MSRSWDYQRAAGASVVLAHAQDALPLLVDREGGVADSLRHCRARARRPTLAGVTGRWCFWTTALVLSGLVVWAIWCVDYLPTNDGPQHVFAAYASAHLDDPTRGYGDFLERGSALTSLGFHTLYSGALRILPWRPALRLTVSLAALAWSWAFVALAGTFGPRRRWVGLLGFATALQWSLYMGFLSFFLGMALGVATLALGCRVQPWTPIHRVGIGALLLSQTMCHAFTALLTGPVLGLLAVLRTKRARERVRETARLLLMATPSLVVLGLVAGQGPALDLEPWPVSFGTRLTLVARAFVAGPQWRCWPAVAVAVAGAALAARGRWGGDARALSLSGSAACCASRPQPSAP